MSHANVSVFVPHIGCPHQCSFCNQRSISGQQSAPTPAQVRAVCEQTLRERRTQLEDTQLAFFGGSFTAIERGYMVSLLEAVQPYLGAGGFSGIRISTRPDAIGEEILELLKRYGVNAIELGIQSMKDRVLAANHRGHTAQDTVRAARLIRQAGIEFGAQMMTGLYQSSVQDDRETAQEIADLHPATVRIYPTIVLTGTQLAEQFDRGDYLPPSLEESTALCAELLLFFERQGIRVIRLGLHAQESLQQGMVAGPYHPAFRELCEARLYRENALEQMQTFAPGVPLDLWVGEGCSSKMAGQYRCNLIELGQRNPLKIRTRADLHPFEVLVTEATKRRLQP